MPWWFWPRKDACQPAISSVRRLAACEPAVSESRNRPDLIGKVTVKIVIYHDIAVAGVPGELKHLSNLRKINQIEIPSVAASEIGTV